MFSSRKLEIAPEDMAADLEALKDQQQETARENKVKLERSSSTASPSPSGSPAAAKAPATVARRSSEGSSAAGRRASVSPARRGTTASASGSAAPRRASIAQAPSMLRRRSSQIDPDWLWQAFEPMPLETEEDIAHFDDTNRERVIIIQQCVRYFNHLFATSKDGEKPAKERLERVFKLEYRFDQLQKLSKPAAAGVKDLLALRAKILAQQAKFAEEAPSAEFETSDSGDVAKKKRPEWWSNIMDVNAKNKFAVQLLAHSCLSAGEPLMNPFHCRAHPRIYGELIKAVNMPERPIKGQFINSLLHVPDHHFVEPITELLDFIRKHKDLHVINCFSPFLINDRSEPLNTTQDAHPNTQTLKTMLRLYDTIFAVEEEEPDDAPDETDLMYLELAFGILKLPLGVTVYNEKRVKGHVVKQALQRMISAPVMEAMSIWKAFWNFSNEQKHEACNFICKGWVVGSVHNPLRVAWFELDHFGRSPAEYKQMYMDEMVTGSATAKELMLAKRELLELKKSLGGNLGKGTISGYEKEVLASLMPRGPGDSDDEEEEPAT